MNRWTQDRCEDLPLHSRKIMGTNVKTKNCWGIWASDTSRPFANYRNCIDIWAVRNVSYLSVFQTFAFDHCFWSMDEKNPKFASKSFHIFEENPSRKVIEGLLGRKSLIPSKTVFDPVQNVLWSKQMQTRKLQWNTTKSWVAAGTLPSISVGTNVFQHRNNSILAVWIWCVCRKQKGKELAQHKHVYPNCEWQGNFFASAFLQYGNGMSIS